MKNKRKILSQLMLTAGLLSAQFATTSYAQIDEPEITLEEIIVTANRREQSIQDVSGVVQSISDDDIRRAGITEFRQLQLAVPGLSIGNQEGNVELFIRGVGSSNNTELGDPGAASHLNGVYIPRPRGLSSFFFDVDRVEINKGPQGTLYGRNGLAGTLNVLTKRPDFNGISGYAQLETLSRDGNGAEGAINVPLSDKTAVRVAGYQSEKDFGFNNAGVQTLDPAGFQDDTGLRVSLAHNPNERTSILVVADYGLQEGTGYPGANINEAVRESGLRPEQLNLRDVRYRGQQGDLRNELAGFQALVTYDFDGFQLEYSGSFRTLDFEQTNASSDGIAFAGANPLQEDNFSNTFWNTTSDSIVQELRLSSTGDGPLQWTTGIFGFVEDQEVAFQTTADRGFCCFSGVEFTFPDVNTDSFAIYGDVTWAVNDKLRLIGGLRFTDEHKDRFGIGGGYSLVNGGDGFSCCIATRVGTEGFQPAGLSRPNFDVSQIDTNQERAQFILEGIGSPGARDDLISQLQSVAAGLTANGECQVRPDIDNGFATCPENGLFSFQNIGIPSQQDGETDNDFVDFRLGFEYDISDEHMVYAKISSGNKSGGFNDSFEGFVPEEFGSEELLAYEIGSRLTYEAFGNPATFNATVFYYDYSDQVFQDLTCINFDMAQNECNGFALVNRNIGESELIGLELESRLNFDNNLSFDVFAVILDSEIKSGVVADAREQDFGNGGITPLIDLSGNRLPRQSNFELTARLSQEFALGTGTFDWQVIAKYRSSFFLNQFNERDLVSLSGQVQSALEIGQASEQEAFTTINVGMGYTFGEGKIRLEAYGQNITDEEASLSSITASDLDLRFLNDARTFGARAIVRF